MIMYLDSKHKIIPEHKLFLICKIVYTQAYCNWEDLDSPLCALLFVSHELFQNNFVKTVLLQPALFGIQGRYFVHAETTCGHTVLHKIDTHTKAVDETFHSRTDQVAWFLP